MIFQSILDVLPPHVVHLVVSGKNEPIPTIFLPHHMTSEPAESGNLIVIAMCCGFNFWSRLLEILSSVKTDQVSCSHGSNQCFD